MRAPVLHCYRWKQNQSYINVYNAMTHYAQDVARELCCEALWILSHTPVYTLGANAPWPLLYDSTIPVYRTGRGGLITFHGPEQRMIYPFIHVKYREFRVTEYVNTLEQWIIRLLISLGIQGQQVSERRGVWVHDKKIASLGIQIKQHIAFHGMALNLYTPSNAFLKISPCGLQKKFGITSLEQLGAHLHQEEIDGLIWKYCPFR
ncbi:lipoyl(octanoyl) transferase LipB [Holospora curviuscula]|uniref:Octanoyltransferase n=1 Tax=Holospora curviuscula TaxID=1082868 RepID=A0A2S5RI18_9PROT|nr:lipoyl(octanoyl) transferase LipB [Holospora curviuscula]PPE06917.1 Octanoyltransferase [Holospora curviuscula]